MTMSSKDEILASIRSHTRQQFERPDLTRLEADAVHHPDKVRQFAEVMEQVGGRAVVLAEGETLGDVVRRLYPAARRVATTFDTVAGTAGTVSADCATFHADNVERPGDLDGTDVALVHGRVGVCENGAVWIEQDVEQRTIYFIAESLVIVLRRDALVDNMHEAYRLIDTGRYGYGVFISGPSKTADIEQALVLGAHGAHDVTVVLV